MKIYRLINGNKSMDTFSFNSHDQRQHLSNVLCNNTHGDVRKDGKNKFEERK